MKWKMKEGRYIEVELMRDDHLVNAIKFIKDYESVANRFQDNDCYLLRHFMVSEIEQRHRTLDTADKFNRWCRDSKKVYDEIENT